MKCIDQREAAAHVAGLLSDGRAHDLADHLRQCSRCAEQHRRLASLTESMALDSSESQHEDLVDDVLSLVHSGRAERERFPAPAAPARRRLRLGWWLMPALAVPAMAAWLFVGGGTSWRMGQDATDATGFRARGATEERADRWVSMEIFRAHGAGYEPVEERIAADDALAFRYRDRSSPAFTHLLVFAIDDSAQAHWYYPASAEGESISLDGQAETELPDQVRHQLVHGHLRMFAVFSREPLQALAVEKLAVAEVKRLRSASALGRLALPGTGQHTRLLFVTNPQGDGATP